MGVNNVPNIDGLLDSLGIEVDDEEHESGFIGISIKGALEAAKREIDRCPENLYNAEIPRNCIQSYIENNLTGPIVWYHADAEQENNKGEALYWPGYYDLAGAMNIQEIRDNLSQLRNSGGNGTIVGKHGVGARLCALRASPDGVMWWSYKNGKVNGFLIWINEYQQMAYKVFEDYDESVLLPEIVSAGHGTQVEFVGLKPLPAHKMPAESTIKFLSTRWYSRPENLPIKVQRWKKGDSVSSLIEVPSQRQALHVLSDIAETVQLSDALVKVFILKPNLDEIPAGQRYHYAGLYRTKDGGAKPLAKLGVVYDESYLAEIYEFKPGGGVHNRLRSFGITHGQNRVVMLIFPDPSKYGPNDIRTRIELLIKKHASDVDLPFTRWQHEFRAAMPDSIRQYVDQSAVGTEKQSMEIIEQIIAENAQYLMGKKYSKKKLIPDPEGDLKTSERVSDNDDDDDEEKKKRKKKKKKKKRKRVNASGHSDNKSLKFIPPIIKWVEPEPDDALYPDSGIYLPGLNGDPGELQLNKNWKFFIEWQKQVEVHRDDLSESVIKHYTKLVMVLLHVDAIMRARLMKEPNPQPSDFRATVLLPNCRDIAFKEIIRHSAKQKD